MFIIIKIFLQRKKIKQIYLERKIPPSKDSTEKRFDMPDEQLSPKTGDTVKTDDSQLFKMVHVKNTSLKSSEDVIYNSRFKNDM